MEGHDFLPVRRLFKIPRKPVEGDMRPTDTNIISPFHPSSRLDENDVNSDGVSLMRRSSFESELERMLNPSTLTEINTNVEFHGYDISEQGIPLVPVHVDADTDADAEIVSRDAQHSPSPSMVITEASSIGRVENQNEDFSHLILPGCSWLPVTLRWPYMTMLLVITLGLGLLVLALALYSEQHSGLGADKNNSITLFGWRFTPTLVAVVYSLLLMAVIDDLKRTEPYARLSTIEGASASSALFLKPGFFLFDPVVSLQRSKNNGRTNWALLWASVANIITILIVSPFSAALLFPAELTVLKDATFSRLAISSQGTLSLSATDDSIFFRTISTVLLNTTTSAWVSNDFTTLPFWPSHLDEVPLGAVLTESDERWIAETTVYQSGLTCEALDLLSVANWTSNLTYYNNNQQRNIAQNLTSFLLKSSDGCSLGFATSVSGDQDTGHGLWSQAPNFTYPLLGNNVVNGAVLYNASTPMIINSSVECGDRGILFYAAPLKFGTELKAHGYVCNTNYYAADVEVVVTNTAKSSIISFDTDQYNLSKKLLDLNDLDIPVFENTFLTQNWSSKFRQPSYSTRPLAQIGGPLILVGAQNDYDLTAMVMSPQVFNQARQVKQRFLGESMQPVFARIGRQQATSMIGRVAVNERRIVVSFAVGIILIVSLLFTSVLIALVMFHTRLNRRPLNLHHDPASIMGTASLVCSEPPTRALFNGIERFTEEMMIQRLDSKNFYLRSGVLYARHVGDTYQQTDYKKHRPESSDWRPIVIRGWLLLALLTLLISLIVAIGALFGMYRKTGVYQRFLVSDIHLRNKAIESLAPYSIIPTLLAVSVKLWWESIDGTLRRLQPYVSMVRKPTNTSAGAGSSYTTSPIGWVAGKAAKNRQWLLTLVAIGAFLAQIFTVSMSALWDRNPGTRVYQATFSQDQEFRTVPAIFTFSLAAVGRAGGSGTSVNDKKFNSALSNNLENILTSWLYAGIVEGSSNATAAPWTDGEWVFAPVNFTSSPNLFSTSTTKNISLATTALRSRLHCTQIDMSNSSEWIITLDFTNKTIWKDTQIPSDVDRGYELKSYFKDQDASNLIPFGPDGNRFTCCGNETGGVPGKASVGYWTSAIRGEWVWSNG